MRLAYLGTPDVAVPPLRALVADGHDVIAVVTQADKKRGRGSALLPSPVKAAATELGLTVTHRVDDLLDMGAELGVVVAFGRLIRPHVLAALPMINVHFSLLPRWRGAAPVERAILAGDDRTGVCIMQLEEGLDTGPVYACREVRVAPEQTAKELRDELVKLGTEMLLELLRGDTLPEPVPQEGEPTYAAKLEPEDFRLDWSRPAAELHRVVRLGRAWTTFRGRRLKVLRASAPAGGTDSAEGLAPGELGGDGIHVGTGSGTLRLVAVQPEGRGDQAAGEWVRGARLQPGERFGE